MLAVSYQLNQNVLEFSRVKDHLGNILFQISPSVNKSRVEVLSEDGQTLYYGTKQTSFFKRNYTFTGEQSNTTFTMKKKHNLLVKQHFIIEHKDFSIDIKKNNNDWTRFYEGNTEVARWLVRLQKGNTHHVQIEHNATIQSPAFYIFLAELISHA
ncbi:tubby C-terminal domain-like protein [Gracilibacillus salinarum]|uniref:Tubby C-terminal domain-containing protein n=1 Tax=Gracilibacillus salinarum TaxID=2932255 RepID=A0ABY4GIU3_9BACI|nr:hypothetical protein [Gracilibacillus salinarum]UOQ84278.1 hypothetical protein MUN87_16415 [Gracilibacillus salinarum]